MMFVDQLRLSVFSLLDAILECDFLVEEGLIVRGISNSHRNLQLVTQPSEEFCLPLDISVNIFRSIARQSMKVIHILLKRLVPLP